MNRFRWDEFTCIVLHSLYSLLIIRLVYVSSIRSAYIYTYIYLHLHKDIHPKCRSDPKGLRTGTTPVTSIRRPRPNSSPDHPSSLFRIRVQRAMTIPEVDGEQRSHVGDDLYPFLISSLGAKRMIYMPISASVVDDNLCHLNRVIFPDIFALPAVRVCR